MRSQQDDEEDDYRTQQWGHLGRRNGIAGKDSHAQVTSARATMTGSLDPKNTTSYRLLLWLGLRGVRDDFPQ
ncbi:hypothetical protein IVA79_06825 [Bradyrhizobium sp. 138]|uniref:hypothetical protein n=1 Tax=Bradyrhizobium sp. 138 TaxID=2782615 RepID=UPI001FF74F62|nr:hypothetical protein [Bradyrhizobium sp. 138]MCK1733682.1 hypothetical protein [Bradyrhizobium sp. 138]